MPVLHETEHRTKVNIRCLIELTGEKIAKEIIVDTIHHMARMARVDFATMVSRVSSDDAACRRFEAYLDATIDSLDTQVTP